MAEPPQPPQPPTFTYDIIAGEFLVEVREREITVEVGQPATQQLQGGLVMRESTNGQDYVGEEEEYMIFQKGAVEYSPDVWGNFDWRDSVHPRFGPLLSHAQWREIFRIPPQHRLHSGGLTAAQIIEMYKVLSEELLSNSPPPVDDTREIPHSEIPEEFEVEMEIGGVRLPPVDEEKMWEFEDLLLESYGDMEEDGLLW